MGLLRQKNPVFLCAFENFCCLLFHKSLDFLIICFRVFFFTVIVQFFPMHNKNTVCKYNFVKLLLSAH